MFKHTKSSLFGTALLGFMSFAGAHLTPGSLVPAGGGMVHVGEVVAVKWNVQTDHQGGTNIDFSKDGGATWTTVKANFVDGSNLNTYNWTPTSADVTESGKIRICQIGSLNGPGCTDANKVSLPSGTNNSAPYVLVSQPFTVMAMGTSVTSASNATPALSMDFSPNSRTVEIGFDLQNTQPVLLQAFDTQGRLVATLLDGSYAAGSHQLSVFSNRLANLSGSGLFKLKVGDAVKTQTWNFAK